MKKTGKASTVLTIRIPQALDRKLTKEARRRRSSRGEVARTLLASGLDAPADPDPAEDARRQSRLASARASEQDALTFIADAADLRGWK